MQKIVLGKEADDIRPYLCDGTDELSRGPLRRVPDGRLRLRIRFSAEQDAHELLAVATEDLNKQEFITKAQVYRV